MTRERTVWLFINGFLGEYLKGEPLLSAKGLNVILVDNSNSKFRLFFATYHWFHHLIYYIFVCHTHVIKKKTHVDLVNDVDLSNSKCISSIALQYFKRIIQYTLNNM